MCRPQLESPLAEPPAAHAVNDLPSLTPKRGHFEHHLGRVLQVRVHDHDGVARGVVETCRDGDLVTEVSRQEERLHARIHRSQFEQHLPASVGAGVINKHELAVTIELLGDALQPLVELRQDRFLVKDGDNERIRRHRVGVTALHQGFLSDPDRP